MLVGHPLGHSLSPEIHDAIMRESGIDGSYELNDIAPGDLPGAMSRFLDGYDGFNVTIPHKKAVMPFLRGLSAAARRCESVNTVHDGIGYNTDTVGFASAGLPLRGGRVMLLGTGGVAAMMAAESLAAGCAALAVSSRSERAARDFCGALSARFPGAGSRLRVVADSAARDAEVAASDVLLNGTPLGMWPHAGTIPVSPSALHSGLAVFDPVYCPTPTRLVLAARSAGARAVGGLSMLVRQAVAAQCIWNPGLAIDADAVTSHLLPDLAATLWRKNPTKILLVGFMGCGKSTVGRAIAAAMDLPFVDLDSEIERFAGRPIPEIFRTEGEGGFREIERRVGFSVLNDSKTSAVVASGGGFPMSRANREAARDAGALVVWLDVPFAEIWNRIGGASGRPLAASRESSAVLYARRLPTYRAFCDAAIAVRGGDAPQAVAAKVVALLAP